MDSKANFQKIASLSEEASNFACIRALLFWDQQTGMPEIGASFRGKQIEAIATLVHDKLTSKKYRNALEKLIDLETGTITASELSQNEKICLREWRHDYLITSKIPKSLISELAEHKAITVKVWAMAKKENAFLKVAPYLEKMIHLVRKQADYIGYKSHPYDALLQMFEAPFCHNAPDFTKAKLDKLFGAFKKEIIPFAKKAHEKQKNISPVSLPNSPKKEEALLSLLQDFMNLPKDRVTTSRSVHPFCLSVGPLDHRFTVLFKNNQWEFGLLAALHEAGHALYNLGLPTEHFGTPLGQPSSMGIHESQSRIWETAVGLSESFSKWLTPHLKKLYPAQFKNFTPKKIYQYLNRAILSPNRVGSCELFYNQHIFMRYEIECALFDGSLSVKDIPEVWNAKSEEYLFVKPKNHSEGCLQDIHWYLGLMGYFPSYTLGNLFMAATYENFQKTQPSWEKDLSKGNPVALNKYLEEKIHSKGRRYPPAKLIKKVSGSPLSHHAFMRHVTKKASSI